MENHNYTILSAGNHYFSIGSNQYFNETNKVYLILDKKKIQKLSRLGLGFQFFRFFLLGSLPYSRKNLVFKKGGK